MRAWPIWAPVAQSKQSWLDAMLAGTVNHITWHKQTNKLAFQWEVPRLSTATLCTCEARGNEKDRNKWAAASNEMEMSTRVLQRGLKWDLSNWPGVFIRCKVGPVSNMTRTVNSGAVTQICMTGNDIFSSRETSFSSQIVECNHCTGV